ncbi:MAG: hypothetical protein QW051_02180 [Candidatus Aenigmatarchaeota archaeon]
MSENYSNGKIDSWYKFTVRRFNNLFKMNTNELLANIDGNESFFDFKTRYLLEAAKKADYEITGFYEYMERMVNKMKKQIKENGEKYAIVGKKYKFPRKKFLFFMLLIFAMPKIGLINLANPTLSAKIATISKKMIGIGF